MPVTVVIWVLIVFVVSALLSLAVGAFIAAANRTPTPPSRCQCPACRQRRNLP